MSPGRSAITNVRSASTRTIPRAGVKRREGIVGDLGLRRRHARDERGLAGVGKADDADVGEQLDLEPEPSAGSRSTEVGAPRGAIGRRGEARVAPATSRPRLDEHALAWMDEVAEDLAAVPIVDHRAQRHAEEQVPARGPVAIGPLAMLATGGVIVAPVVVVEQRAQSGIGLHPHAAAVSAVAAVRTAVRHVLLTPETDAARAPVAALDEDLDLVDEHRGPGGTPARPQEAAVVMLT